MIDENIVLRKLQVLGDCLQELARVEATSASLAANNTVRAAVERWLQVSVEACLDIAYHIVSDEGWTPVDTGRSAFLSLASHGVISAELAAKLGRAAGLRNLLVHDYARIELDVLAKVVHTDLEDLREFRRVIAAKLMAQSP